MNSGFWLAWPIVVLGLAMIGVSWFNSDTVLLVALAQENGLIENVQLGFILASVALFLALAAMSAEADRMVSIGAAALCAVFFVREADFRAYGADFPLAFVDDRLFKSLWYTLIPLGLLVYAFLRRDLVVACLRFVCSRNSWAFVLAVILLAAGDVAEKLAKQGSARWLFAEEALELIAYFAILTAGLAFIAALYPRQRASTSLGRLVKKMQKTDHSSSSSS